MAEVVVEPPGKLPISPAGLAVPWPQEATPENAGAVLPSRPMMMLDNDIDMEEIGSVLFEDDATESVDAPPLAGDGTESQAQLSPAQEQIAAIKRWQQDSSKPLTYIGVKRRYIIVFCSFF